MMIGAATEKVRPIAISMESHVPIPALGLMYPAAKAKIGPTCMAARPSPTTFHKGSRPFLSAPCSLNASLAGSSVSTGMTLSERDLEFVDRRILSAHVLRSECELVESLRLPGPRLGPALLGQPTLG